MNRRVVLAAVVLLLVTAAAALAVLAVDVLRWRGHLEQADMQYATGRATPRMWEPDVWFPGATRSLLGVKEDVQLRQALQHFRLANVRRPPRELGDVTRRSQVEAELARVRRSDADSELRSLAAVLTGALAFEEARNSGQQAGVFLRRSLTAFREAVRVEPANEDAKYNVELVLRLLQTLGQEESGGTGAQRGNVTARGAGAGTGGTGF